MDQPAPKLHIAVGKDETVEALDDLRQKVERGEVHCFAVRVFKPDGTWEDIAAGGSAEEQEQALADLRAAYHQAN